MTAELPMSDSPSPIERRLATILCADVAGYSRMMGTNEERTVRVFRGHREIFESLVKLHRGRIFNTAGDALLAEFNSAVEAVRCATEIQAALRTRNEHLVTEERMQFRIGINLGDVIVQGDDLLGDGVNVAARIQAATEPGGICISGSVHDQIQNKLSLDFKPLGEQTYKNIAKPVRTYMVAEGTAATRPQRQASWRVPATMGAALVAIGGAGYWGYLQVETRRAEQARVEAQRAAEKEATARAQHAADEAKRRAEVQEQRLAAEEVLRKTQEERSRAEVERRRLDSDRRAIEAAKRDAAEDALRRSEQERERLERDRKQLIADRQAAEARATAAAAERTIAAFDGLYAGQLCNNPRSATPQCWPVALTIRGGSVEGTWVSRTTKTATARGAVSSEGIVHLTLSTWAPDGQPTEAPVRGRLTDGAIDVRGEWRTGGEVSGNWKRGAMSAAAPAMIQSVGQHDGKWAGELCNQFQSKPPCWKVALTIRNGVIEGSWPNQATNRTATARGTVTNDGAVRLTVSSWAPSGSPVQAILQGRIEQGWIRAPGEWSTGGRIIGSWQRTP